jgi:hypothetical protein
MFLLQIKQIHFFQLLEDASMLKPFLMEVGDTLILTLFTVLLVIYHAAQEGVF